MEKLVSQSVLGIYDGQGLELAAQFPLAGFAWVLEALDWADNGFAGGEFGNYVIPRWP